MHELLQFFFCIHPCWFLRNPFDLEEIVVTIREQVFVMPVKLSDQSPHSISECCPPCYLSYRNANFSLSSLVFMKQEHEM